MISDDGQPILMDFGSTTKARIKIENRSQALLQQVRQKTYSYPRELPLHVGVISRISLLNRARWRTARQNSLM